MVITATRKIIEIGDSKGVTLPAKELKAAGIKEGDLVTVQIKPSKPQANIDKEYEAFKKQYGETLKNLSKR